MLEAQEVVVRDAASGKCFRGGLPREARGPRHGEGVANPTAFYNPGQEMRHVLHGDDFAFLGWEDDLEEMALRWPSASERTTS